jgi:hypothetical protein
MAQQAGSDAALGTTQQGIQGIEQDRLARPRLAGEHGEAVSERQFEAFDQGDVLQAQTREHPNLPR